ncbi:MAG: MerR family transcriptional regulator [Candidatus Zixiibacteriota bacterium]|jgi:MerR family transcriptional regulator/heat shock protein HspR
MEEEQTTDLDEKERLYPIGIASELLGVHPRTLRLYEEAGLLTPRRRRGRRYYNEDDLKWLECIRHLIHDEKISVEGLRRLVQLQDCWEIRGCGRQGRGRCGRYGRGAGRHRGGLPDDNEPLPETNGKEE